MATEFLHENHIIVLDGRTVEIFTRASLREPYRFHVAFMGVYVKPKRDEFHVRIGHGVGEDVMGGVTMTMDGATFERFRAFIAQATAARDSAPNP
jgi:hypothetical protein